MQQSLRLQWHIAWNSRKKRILQNNQVGLILVLFVFAQLTISLAEMGYSQKTVNERAILRTAYIPFEKVLKTNFLLNEQVSKLTQELQLDHCLKGTALFVFRLFFLFVFCQRKQRQQNNKGELSELCIPNIA